LKVFTGNFRYTNKVVFMILLCKTILLVQNRGAACSAVDGMSAWRAGVQNRNYFLASADPIHWARHLAMAGIDYNEDTDSDELRGCRSKDLLDAQC
jgi:hypothetical protein